MLRRSLLASLLVVCAAALASPAARAAAGPPLVVYAAASLTDVLQEIGADYERRTGTPVKFSYAASSVLARQIEAGTQADVFVSADEEWMDYLATRRLVRPGTRVDVAANRLVLVAPADSRSELDIAPRFPLAAALGAGRLAIADPATVPAGRYAKAALEHFGVWTAVESRIVGADNVRSALAFVARGEAPLGIVYATDALRERSVRVVDTFPTNSHPPVTYPAAAVASGRRGADAFVAYLAGPAAQELFARYGFLTPR